MVGKSEIVIALVIVVAIVLIMIIVRDTLLIYVKRRSIVLQKINMLNSEYRNELKVIDILTLEFELKSKQKFDKFDEKKVLLENIESNAICYEEYLFEIKNMESIYELYLQKYESLVTSKITFHGVLILSGIENALIRKNKVKCDFSKVLLIRCTYESPQGRNFYTESFTFSLEELQKYYIECMENINYKKTEEYRRKNERAKMSKSLRYDVLNRDGYRCVICGRSAKDGTILHVDHIIPVAKGGSTTLDNLQTLCESCNLGKSDKCEKDEEVFT